MKERIDAETRDKYVYYRIQRALETLEEADCLADNGHFSGAVNRLYYACYYIVSALLIYHDIEASSHAGVKSMFALKFIKTGIMDIILTILHYTTASPDMRCTPNCSTTINA